MDRERFEKQLNFILEIDKEKQILRQTHIRGYSRQEDDAEHAWHMAVMAFLLQEYSNEKIDIGRTMLMLLIHDLVEIDADLHYRHFHRASCSCCLFCQHPFHLRYSFTSTPNGKSSLAARCVTISSMDSGF